MSEFEELLRDVLAADVCVEPPTGMEGRISAALSGAKARSFGQRRSPLEAIAAAFLIGIAGLLAFRHHREALMAAMPREKVLIARAAEPTNEIATAPSAALARGRSSGSSQDTTARSKQRSSRAVASIAPLTVAPLVVEPIEVASLNLGKSTD